MADDKHSSVVSQIVAGLVLAAIVGAISFVQGAFKWVTEVVTNFWSHLRGTSGFPNWSLYLLALLSIHTLVYWATRIIKSSGPNLAAYNHDSFLGLKWRWSYISGHPANAWAFCPRYDTMLVYTKVGSFYGPDRKTVLTCETCARDLLHHEGDKDYLVQKIHRQIDRKIRTGEWERVIETNP